MEPRLIRPSTFIVVLVALALAAVIDFESGWVLLPIIAAGDLLLDWFGVDLRPGRHRS